MIQNLIFAVYLLISDFLADFQILQYSLAFKKPHLFY